VLPGGVDSHCHIEQLEADGSILEETFETAGISAIAGGTTTVIPFSPQFKGEPISAHLDDYRARAARSPIDYALHKIITDPTDSVLGKEIPQLIEAGIRSLKVFLTYDPLHIDDRQFLRVLEAAKRFGATVCVHCENYDAIRWRSEDLLAQGRTEPSSHALSRPKWWSVKQPTGRSRSQSSSASRSTFSTSPALKWPTKLQGPSAAASR